MRYIIANWKMNMNKEQVNSWLNEFSKLTSGKDLKSKVLLAPSFPYLEMVNDFCRENACFCCAQNVSLFEKGAHTGYVGAFQIKDLCPYSIIGHSERNEETEAVIKKRDACLQEGITPIVCFTQKEDWSKKQAQGALLAWEDPSNISQGGVYREKDPQEIEGAYKYFAQETAGSSIIYGGSVHRGNAPALAKIPNLGGALIGNASLDPQHFLDIISAFA